MIFEYTLPNFFLIVPRAWTRGLHSCLSNDEISTLKDFKKVFINPEMVEETGEEWDFTEGCLSIPNIREDISRKENIIIRYYDESFEKVELNLGGLAARIVQHEYDHIEGVLFTDKLSSLKKKLLKGKLNDISNNLKTAIIVIELNISFISKLHCDCFVIDKGVISSKISLLGFTKTATNSLLFFLTFNNFFKELSSIYRELFG